MRTFPQIFSQKDPRWGNIFLGSSPSVTISADGCYITSFAMLAQYYGKNVTPADINNYFKNAGLFANSDLVSNDNDLQDIFSDILFVETDHYESVAADLGKLKTYMQDLTTSVVLCIDLGGGSVHFVVCADCDGATVTIANPWTGNIEPFTQFYGDPAKNILKFVVYKGTIAAPTNDLAACQLDRDTNWNLATAITSKLGVTANASDKVDMQKQALTAIDNLNLTISNDNTTIANLNKSLPELHTQIAGLEGQVATLTADVSNDRGQKYKDLYNIAQQDLTELQSTYAAAQKTWNAQIGQYSKTSALLIPISQLFSILMLRVFKINIKT